MNGFFKIIRGINNLGIESDCAFLEPDVTEEELVWEETPAYGGSIFGIVPFTKEAQKYPVKDSLEDVTKANADGGRTATDITETTVSAQQQVHRSDNRSTLSFGFFYFATGCVCTVLVTQLLTKMRRRSYSTLN